MSLNLEDVFSNETNEENLPSEGFDLILNDLDSAESEWRLPLAIIFAIVMMIYLVIVIVILSGRAGIFFDILVNT